MWDHIGVQASQPHDMILSAVAENVQDRTEQRINVLHGDHAQNRRLILWNVFDGAPSEEERRDNVAEPDGGTYP